MNYEGKLSSKYGEDKSKILMTVLSTKKEMCDFILFITLERRW